MKYISICSGIEAATVAWHPLGWEPLAFSEIEKFPCGVLAHHYPDTPNLGDMTKYHTWPEDILAECDVLVGGCPCQAFSVAGLRKSLDDERGNLTLVYIHLANHIDEIRRKHGRPPIIIVYENVPGILSTKDNAFGCFLAGLVGEENPLVPAGKRWTDACYVSGPQRIAVSRILDAQYFGVAQRRRRVFVVASARNGLNPAKVLFEFEGMRRDTPPSREKGESITHSVAPSLTSSGRGVERGGDTRGQDPVVACFGGNNTSGPIDLSTTCNAHGGPPGRLDFESETFVTQYGPLAGSLTARHDSSPCAGRGMNVIAFKPGQSADAPSVGAQEEVACTLESGGGGNNKQAVCFQQNTRDEVRLIGGEGSLTGALQAEAGMKQQNYIQNQMQVRRLTPKEYCRLQGFPDDYTNIKPNCPDGPRYKALGNSMAVPVMHWIGKRIQKEVDRVR